MRKKKGPQTINGMIRRDLTGDGRKRLDTAIRRVIRKKEKEKINMI